MPNRSELALPAIRSDSSAAGDNTAWLVLRLCAIGWMISIYLALLYQPLDQLPMLIAASAWG